MLYRDFKISLYPTKKRAVSSEFVFDANKELRRKLRGGKVDNGVNNDKILIYLAILTPNPA